MTVVAATNKSAGPELDLDEVYHFQLTEAADAEASQFDKPGEIRRVYTLKVLSEQRRPITNSYGDPITVKYWVTLYNPMRPRSAAYGLCSALLYGGNEIPEQEEVDDDDLVGKFGRFLWSMKTDLKGKPTNPGITKVMPPTARGNGAKATVTAEAIDTI